MPERPYRTRELHDHLVRSANACQERAGLDQSTPTELLPAQQLCIRCGRVTARRNDAGLPWCGGDPVAPGQRLAEIWPGRPLTPNWPYARAA